jgi:magnesium-transporting ATPase (P-type)
LYLSIISANALNVANVILVVSGTLTVVVDSWRVAPFLGIAVANIAIGSFQQIGRSALHQLDAPVAPEAVVIRDGVDARVPVDEVVVGDRVRRASARPPFS